MTHFCGMVLAEQKHRISAWMLGAICAALCMPEANAQLAFEPIQIQANPGDSLDLMTQMWHALPEAEVGGIALAGGASEPAGSRVHATPVGENAPQDVLRRPHSHAACARGG